MRIEVAKELLETSRRSLEQIAHETGYSDTTSFRRLFTRLTSLSPAQYRNRFSRSDSKVEAR
ncbi:MAG: helix-turn-helix domain-containing protein [Candidatus Thiodiazotropha sp.]